MPLKGSVLKIEHAQSLGKAKSYFSYRAKEAFKVY